MQFTCHIDKYMQLTHAPWHSWHTLEITLLDLHAKTCVREDWSPVLWHCVVEWVTPNIPKDHNAFIFRVTQSKKSHVGQKCVCYIGTVNVDAEWPDRVASQTTKTPPTTMPNRLPPSLTIHYTHQLHLYNTLLTHMALLLVVFDPNDEYIMILQNVGTY
jgi:hypothetical protein